MHQPPVLISLPAQLTSSLPACGEYSGVSVNGLKQFLPTKSDQLAIRFPSLDDRYAEHEGIAGVGAAIDSWLRLPARAVHYEKCLFRLTMS